MIKKFDTWFLLAISLPLFLGACRAHDLQQQRGSDTVYGKRAQSVGQVDQRGISGPEVLDLRVTGELISLLPELAEKRVVYVGETHDRYGHHLNQLQVVQGLHRLNPKLAIGVEFFQQPFQPFLDGYISGRLSESEMLAQTQWFDRWRYDYRLYRPILSYAREQGIPVIALNVPTELTERVSAVGIAGLNEQERAGLPDQIDKSDPDYRQRLRAVFEKHAHGKRDFNRFMEVQLTWDEGMAEGVTAYLEQHPDRQMVVLAGSGHLMFGSGIPQRVTRRVSVESTILLPGDDLRVAPGIADFIVFPEKATLPKAGLMGVIIVADEQGVRVGEVVPESAADRSGLEKGDVIQQLDGARVSAPADIRIGMLDKLPGDKVALRVLRKQLLLNDQVLNFELILGGG